MTISVMFSRVVALVCRAPALATIVMLSGCVTITPRATELPEGGVTVGASLEDGRPAVDVFVNGDGPFSMLVDTGAGPVALDLAVVERLGLPRVARAEWVGITPDGRATRSMPMVRIEAIELGGARFRDLVGVAIDTPDYDGVLGMATFAQCTLTVDLREARIHLSGDPLDTNDPWTVGSSDADGTPTVPVVVRDGEAVFACTPTLDTGASGGIELPVGVADSIGFWQTAWQHSMSAAGRSRHPIGRLYGTMSIGPGIEIQDPETVLITGPGLVGVRFLRDYVISVDIRRDLVRLAPHPSLSE